jgi:hypothetical protein|uniref:Uncharacterized protein n=1 Tax=Bacteriophage sp. TaxID=38018 RepID=A0A8D9PED3_9VIRU|nr:MAG TPA: hypothetical protein [Bacteriophage sp.]
MNDTIKRYFEFKAKNDNKPFMQILNYAYQNGKITDDEALLFCSNGWKKMHGFNMRRVGKIEYRGKGTRYKHFLWSDKVSFVINEKVLRVMKEYVEKKRNGVGLSEKDIGSKRWDWAFWSDLLNVMDDGHI